MEYVKFKDVAYFVTGKLNSNAAKDNGKYRFFTCAPEPLFTDTYSFDKEAILLAGNNAEGNFHINLYKGKFDAYQRTYVIGVIDSSKLNLRYLYYVMKMNLFHLKSISRGTSTKFLTATIINDFDIPYPSIDIQNRLAKILFDLDNKIELNNQMNNNLYEISSQLMRRYLDNVDGEEVKLSELLNVFTGKKNANETSLDGKYKFFSCAPESLLSDTYIFDGAAIIVAGNGAYTGRTRFYDGKFELYQRTYALTLKENNNKNLIYGLYVYMKDYFEKEKMGGTHGSAIPYIVLSDLTDYKLKYNEEEFMKLCNIVANNIMMIQENEEANEVLSRLRDTLLPKLMNGEIDLDNIEI